MLFRSPPEWLRGSASPPAPPDSRTADPAPPAEEQQPLDLRLPEVRNRDRNRDPTHTSDRDPTRDSDVDPIRDPTRAPEQSSASEAASGSEQSGVWGRGGPRGFGSRCPHRFGAVPVSP